ncbi:uncharacterized protein LOC132258579 [Phlebotomus argentipes]|uniref:uncharacterized protein LOC132258579 n=1 Tax=Phlebotomus argentipes TaxID=94469 RepID=UPI002892D028|nr:uncharacterized protein LOC132258579 [Phlebotomus argentipes]
MKCTYIVVLLLVALTKGALIDFEVFTIGNREAGEQLLGFVTNSSQSTTEEDSHSVTLFLNAPPGSRITFVHMNIFPTWHVISHPTALPPDSDIIVHNFLTTHLSANAYYYGFLPESPEAQAMEELPRNKDRKTILNDKY